MSFARPPRRPGPEIKRQTPPAAPEADKRATPKRDRNESSDTLTTSMFHKKRPSPTAFPGTRRSVLGGRAQRRVRAALNQSRPATRNQNLEKRERAAVPTRWPGPLHKEREGPHG